MPGVMETLTIPRASSIPSSSLLLPAGPTRSCQDSVKYSAFRGLKSHSAHSLASKRLPPRLARRGSRIVCEAQETAVEVAAVTDSNWKSLVLDSGLPVLVEFWAPWCGPCGMIHPTIDKLAKVYAGKLKCFKVNTDVSPSIATRYGIRSIPTVIIYKNGDEKDTIIGAVPESALVTSIEKFM
ncbi:uncharacterized protein LOC142540702 [Primulina tabacum]|uniref:uncharacterized protein LOC142540702 n=1 Tax=Primulina tabacum TaxID=48773 RepID=UPI003F5A9BF3